MLPGEVYPVVCALSDTAPSVYAPTPLFSMRAVAAVDSLHPIFLCSESFFINKHNIIHIMRTLNVSWTIVFMLAAWSLAAQSGGPVGDLPANSEPGKCYAKCLIPDEYQEVQEQVLVKPASLKTEVVPAEFATVTERLVKAEGAKKLIASQTTFKTVKEEFEIKEAASQLKYIPAQFETVEERVLIKEESKKLIPVDPVFETVPQDVLIKPETKRLIIVPAEYETVTERVLVKEASQRIERIPVEYKTVEERVEVSPASTRWVKRQADRNCLSEDPNDCLVWCLVEVPAQYKVVTKQVKQACPAGFEVSGEDCIRYHEAPAEYATRTKRVVVKPAMVQEEVVPAEYKKVDKEILRQKATYKEEVIPAEYTVIKKQVVKTPARVEEIPMPAKYTTLTKEVIDEIASVREEEIPTEFETVAKKVVSTDANVRTVEIPAEYATLTKRQLVKKGGFTEWREVLCANKITGYTIRQIQVALKDRGYNPGPIDNVLGLRTKAALTKFQRDKGLPVGQLDLETLQALGIQY